MRITVLVGIIITCTIMVMINCAPARVVLDTDIGTDFDDTWALMYILSRPDVFDLQLIQVSTYTTTGRAQIVAKILDTIKRNHIPIGIGYSNGDQYMPQYAWAKDFSLDNYVKRGGVLYKGTSYFEDLMQQATPNNPLYIVEIAPANSLGDILIRNASLAKNCICVAMSGSIYRGYLNSSNPAVEYNVARNISSSQAMYNAEWIRPLSTAPLDSCNFDQWNGVYQHLLSANDSSHLYASLLLENYLVWYDNGGKGFSGLLPFSPTTGTDVLYDAQAAWMAGRLILNLDEVPLTMKALPILVESDGRTVVDGTKQHLMVNAALGYDSANPYVGSDVVGLDIILSIVSAKLF